jgi:pimeloyl-ACP methyl ester carboxylesterase
MVEFVYSMLNSTPFAVVADFYPAFATLDHFDHLEPLSRVPTAIICGTEDKITSVGHSRKLHSRIPGSSLLECEGAGHMVLLERHKQVTAELDDLISLAQGEGLL